MALPSSGSISMYQVNQELGRSATAGISLGDSAVRSLAGRSSGSVSLYHLRGKSSSLLSSTINIQGDQYGNYWGFSSKSNSFGSLGNTNAGGRTVRMVAYSTLYGGFSRFSVYSNHTGSFWSQINIAGTVTSRTAAGYYASPYTNWDSDDGHMNRTDMLGGRRSGTHSITIT